MVQALVMNGMTATRALVITSRTNDESIGLIKAMMIESLKEKLANGIAHLLYIKKDGSVREAWGTISPLLARRHVNGNGVSRELYQTTAYFDVEKGGWRSLRWESIVKVF